MTFGSFFGSFLKYKSMVESAFTLAKRADIELLKKICSKSIYLILFKVMFLKLYSKVVCSSQFVFILMHQAYLQKLQRFSNILLGFNFHFFNHLKFPIMNMKAFNPRETSGNMSLEGTRAKIALLSQRSECIRYLRIYEGIQI